MSPEERFWSHVQKTADCWLWTGARDRDGYGSVGWAGKTMLAHRVAYLIEHGSLPPLPIEICHSCDTPACVRPSHLFPGTHRENMDDHVSKGRSMHVKNVARGARNGRSKYPESTIRRIHELGGTMTQAKIAAALGVSQPLVSMVLGGKLWQEIG